MELDTNEKILSESVTIQGKIIFTTYRRDTSEVNKCEPNLWQGRVFFVDAFNGLPVADLYMGDDGILDPTDNPTNEDRYKDLTRSGIPSDPLVIFRDDNGTVDPNVLVTTEVVLGKEVLGTNPHKKTWWIDVDE